MIDFIADGEIHPLSEQYAYILRFFDESKIETDPLIEISEIQRGFCCKYAQYLMKFEQDKVLNMLMNQLMPTPLGETSDDHQFIYRPAEICSMLSQNSSIALKFRRSPMDNLDPIKDMETLNEPQI